MIKIAICLTGYYFRNLNLYKSLLDEAKLNPSFIFDFYILSHKKVTEIDRNILNYLRDNNWQIIFEENVGWDWGCHVQFMQWLSKKNNQKPDYILFLHDDIRIVKNGFVEAFMNKIKQGFELVGNSSPFTKIDNFKDNYFEEAFILNRLNIPFAEKEIKIVRGSAFFTTFGLADSTLKNLPYQITGNIHMANRSLRLFASMVAEKVSVQKVCYLDKRNFESDFIIEEMRGKKMSPFFKILRQLNQQTKKLFKAIFKKYQYFRLNQSKSNCKNRLKIHISKTSVLNGYLNIHLGENKKHKSDIDDYEDLIKNGRVCEVKISDDLIAYNEQIMSHIISSAKRSKQPVRIFIEVSKNQKTTVKKVIPADQSLKIHTFLMPKGDGFNWISNLVIDVNF
ncbi:hypothetical protein [Winogradskyella algicola]|uniref:hypothetical protein n=1 Tax=Winogradskyella algicola TaxID=2575815 RepID=UPI00110933B5|nr:hypothetical protein [Winogradskyella algicola]